VLAAYLVVVSAATLFIAFALGNTGTISAGLYYLPHSTFTAAALFLVADLIRRRRRRGGQHHDGEQTVLPGKTGTSLLFLVAAVAIAGLPPLAGFLAKAALLSAVPDTHTAVVWAAVLGSSLLVIIGLTRTGIRLFWHVPGADEAPPEPESSEAPPRPFETAAASLLLAYVVAMAIFAAPLMRQTDAIAAQLLAPAQYLDDVRGTTPQVRQP